MTDTPQVDEELIAARIEDSIAIRTALRDQVQDIRSVAERLISAYQRGRKAVFFGNGGSATDAQHMAAEFVGRFYLDRRPFPALALTENVASMTGIGNDYGFENIFSRQIEALATEGDVAIGLSTSGNSPNIVEGLRAAKRLGLVTVALTGRNGGQLGRMPELDFCLRVPSDDTPRIQENHGFICHLWCEFVESALVSERSGVRSIGGREVLESAAS